MNKKENIEKIKEVEKNLPGCVDNLSAISAILMVAGIVLGIITILAGLYIFSEDGFVGFIVIVSGVAVIFLLGIRSAFFEAMKEITANTYRSAEYAKIQLEIMCSDENSGAETANKVQKVDDEFPML
ncbi:MAG: hypothetical protein LUH47_07355 [Clostridiales bacterium]|nr:hypothetical protein [Clostridiales bacterium]